MDQFVSCNRRAEGALGGRCRSRAGVTGRCESVLSHKDGTAPRADEPTVVLVKFKLFSSAMQAAKSIFREVIRGEEQHFDDAHALIALLSGRKFKGVRGEGERGDSGTAVFGRRGLPNPQAAGLESKLMSQGQGFVLADVHCFKRDGGQGFLVLGYRKGVKPAAITADQGRFIDRSYRREWGVVHVWANVPEYVGEIQGSRFQFLILNEKEDGELTLAVTKPALHDDQFVVNRNEISGIEQVVLHTVNFTGRTDESATYRPALTYNDGLWGYQLG